MAGSFQIESQAGAQPGHRILRMSGRLGLDTVPEFLKEIRAANDPVVILDFTELSYIDSAGVGSLVQTLATLKKSDRRLALAAVNDRVRAVLEITRVHNLFPHFATLGEAEEKLR